jgi:hypothetical protein
MKTFSDAIHRAHKIMGSEWRMTRLELAMARRYEAFVGARWSQLSRKTQVKPLAFWIRVALYGMDATVRMIDWELGA